MMSELAEALRLLLNERTASLVELYFTPRQRFAGSTFDTLPPNPRDRFTAGDLLATSLLDVPFLPRVVRSLLQDDAHEFSALLDAIPANVDLWNATDDDLQPAYALWDRLRELEGVGPTRTSKLLARKRPRLIPVVDRVIRERLPLGEDSWLSFRGAMRDESLRAAIEALRPSWLPPSVTTLRVLDAALWMRYSQSTHVIALREPE